MDFVWKATWLDLVVCRVYVYLLRNMQRLVLVFSGYLQSDLVDGTRGYDDMKALCLKRKHTLLLRTIVGQHTLYSILSFAYKYPFSNMQKRLHPIPIRSFIYLAVLLRT